MENKTNNTKTEIKKKDMSKTFETIKGDLNNSYFLIETV